MLVICLIVGQVDCGNYFKLVSQIIYLSKLLFAFTEQHQAVQAGVTLVLIALVDEPGHWIIW